MRKGVFICINNGQGYNKGEAQSHCIPDGNKGKLIEVFAAKDINNKVLKDQNTHR